MSVAVRAETPVSAAPANVQPGGTAGAGIGTTGHAVPFPGSTSAGAALPRPPPPASPAPAAPPAGVRAARGHAVEHRLARTPGVRRGDDPPGGAVPVDRHGGAAGARD